MTRKRTGRLSRRDAERTLTDPAGAGSALGTALSSAAGPARPAELRGEDAAAAAFHASRLAAPPATRDHYVSPTRLAGRATTRLIVATGAVLALGAGGLAVATGAQLDDLAGLTGLTSDSTQSATSPADSPSDDPTSDVPSPSTSPTPDGQGDHQGDQQGDDRDDDQGDDQGGESGRPDDGASSGAQPETPTTPGGSTRPDPQADRWLERACRDLLHPGLERGHDDNLAALLEQAGGADQVEAFCVDLLAAKPDKPAKPAKPEKPTKPTKPAKPEKPDKPAKPAKPDKPSKPDKPAKPAKPEKPTKPDKPSKPAKPDKAEKPGHAGPRGHHSRRGGPMTPG